MISGFDYYPLRSQIRALRSILRELQTCALPSRGASFKDLNEGSTEQCCCPSGLSRPSLRHRRPQAFCCGCIDYRSALRNYLLLSDPSRSHSWSPNSVSMRNQGARRTEWEGFKSVCSQVALVEPVPKFQRLRFWWRSVPWSSSACLPLALCTCKYGVSSCFVSL